jgi:hypothetical protein
MGTLYLLNSYGSDRYKIGVTRRDVEKRVKELQTGCPDEIILINEYECDNYHKLEGWLHRKHFSKRVEGEWFVLEDGDVMSFIEDCKVGDATIQLLIKENPFYK